MNTIFEKISNIGIIPVIAIEDVEKAVPLAKALVDGGIPCAEVTFRTSAGEAAMRRIADAFPEVLLGAGTVLNTKQVDSAIDAGAKFIVSPGFNPKVVDYCIERGITVIPGCVTPGEIEQAIEKKLEVVKFFPAEQSGGTEYIQAVSAPYQSMHFIPTGGININNIERYLHTKNVIACGGSWMVKKELIAESNFDKMTVLCQEAMRRVLNFKLKSICIHNHDEQEAQKAAKLCNLMFGAVLDEGHVIATKENEKMKTNCIRIGVSDVARGRTYLANKGFHFDEREAKEFVFLKEKLFGFFIQLIQN